MKNIEVLKYQNDVTIFADGAAYISQRKLAEILGVNQNTLKKYIRSTHYNYMTDKGLDAFLVASSTHYFATTAKTRSEKAIELSAKFMIGGATAWMYHEAGYTMNAELKQSTQALIIPPEDSPRTKYTKAVNREIVVRAVEELMKSVGTLRASAELLIIRAKKGSLPANLEEAMRHTAHGKHQYPSAATICLWHKKAKEGGFNALVAKNIGRQKKPALLAA